MSDDFTTYRGSLVRNTAELSEWHASALQEEALEPALPIIDAHHHLFETLYGTTTKTHSYPRGAFERDIQASGHRVVATVYVEAYESGWRVGGPPSMRAVGEIESIVEASREAIATDHGPCQMAAAIVAYADLTLVGLVDELLEAELAAGAGRMRAVRQMAARDGGLVGRFIRDPAKPGLLADPTFRQGLARLQARGLTFEAWLYHHQLDEIADLATAFPDMPIVVDHLGGLIGVGEYRPPRADVLAGWRNALRRVAARPNVYLKIGGLGMPMFGFGFEHRERPPTSRELADAWKPLIESCIEAFGPQRCMFESNYPVDKQSCGYTQLWNAYKLASKSFSPDERSELFHRTACRAYGLSVEGVVGEPTPASATAKDTP